MEKTKRIILVFNTTTKRIAASNLLFSKTKDYKGGYKRIIIDKDSYSIFEKELPEHKTLECTI